MTSSVSARNIELDFFRGLALLIIFIGHSIGNPLANYMPRNFGFSDAAEIFVYCSGLASAWAFGPLFMSETFWKTTARILHRCWQIYWVHIALAFSVLALMVSGEETFGRLNSFDDYRLFFDKTQQALPALMTLQWLPAYLDILPLYLVLLAAIPLIMLLRRLHPLLPFLAVGALYIAVWSFDLHIQGKVPIEARWFFNPYAWQLLFFSGFFIGMGWVKVPPLRQPGLIFAATFFVLAAIPVCTADIYAHHSFWNDLRNMLVPGWHKHNLHILRYMHFLCLAYLTVSLLSLKPQLVEQPWAKPVSMAGRQVLASFVAGIFIARFVTIAYELVPDHHIIITLAANLMGCALVIGAAYVANYFKALAKQRSTITAK
ncbi:MAG: OpgC domain-containing protein [Pseudomonadota bacterium]